jgi:hypothetical protein
MPVIPKVSEFTFKTVYRWFKGNILVLSWIDDDSSRKAILTERIGVPVPVQRNQQVSLPSINIECRDIKETRCFQKEGKFYMEIYSIPPGWHAFSLGLFRAESRVPAASTQFFCRIPEPYSIWKNLLRVAGCLMLIGLILFLLKFRKTD